MIVVAGPPGSGKTSSFPVTAFGVDAFNIDDRCAQILGSYRAIPRHAFERVDIYDSTALWSTPQLVATSHDGRIERHCASPLWFEKGARDARVLTLGGSAEVEPWQLVSMLLTNLTVRTDVDTKHNAPRYPETLSRSGIPNPRVPCARELCRSRDSSRFGTNDP